MARTAKRHPKLPSDDALRFIMEEEPRTTVAELVEYFGVADDQVRRALDRIGIKAAPQSRRILPPDEELKPLLEAAAHTGYGILCDRFGVSAARLSQYKKRLGVVWPQDRKRALEQAHA